MKWVKPPVRWNQAADEVGQTTSKVKSTKRRDGWNQTTGGVESNDREEEGRGEGISNVNCRSV